MYQPGRPVEDRDRDTDVVREADLDVAGAAGADRLHGKAVAQDRVMPHLVQPGVVQPQPGRAAQVNHLAAPDP